jgi:GT2 family glycosyltransferase
MTPVTENLPLLTINILTYNRKTEVDFSIQKILNEIDYPLDRLEVIVVDNASTDGTAEFIKKKYPIVRVLKNKIDVGTSGWNLGFQAAKGKYILCLDDDSHPEKGVIDAIKYMEQHPKVGIVACAIRESTGIITEDSILTATGYGFIGCGEILSQDLLKKIGGFVNWIFVYHQELEYSMRTLDNDFQIHYFRDCVCFHRGSLINRDSRFRRVEIAKNELGIIYSHFTGLFKIGIIIDAIIDMFTVNFIEVFKKRKTLMTIGAAFKGLKDFLRDFIQIKKVPIRKKYQKFFATYHFQVDSFLQRIKKLIRKLAKK